MDALDKGKSDLSLELQNLNNLARSTPEGYMEIIDEKDFENVDDSNYWSDNYLSKKVEAIFQRICESVELYKTENI